MAADTPLNKLVLSAASVADDVGYAALADLAHVLGEVTRAEIIHPRTHSSTYSSRHTQAGPGRTSRSPSICLLPKFQGFRSRWHAPR